MSLRPEAKLEAYFIKQAKIAHVWQNKFISGVTGVPDRIIIANGTTAFVELKAKDGRLSERQKLVIAQIRSHGGTVYVPFSKQDIDDIFAVITNTGQPNDCPVST